MSSSNAPHAPPLHGSLPPQGGRLSPWGGPATKAPLHIVIATRESRLALWQAEHVQALLRAQGHTVELLGMTTKGDQILDRSLSKAVSYTHLTLPTICSV